MQLTRESKVTELLLVAEQQDKIIERLTKLLEDNNIEDKEAQRWLTERSGSPARLTERVKLESFNQGYWQGCADTAAEYGQPHGLV